MCGNCRKTQLTKGEKGDNGATAFKFVKEVSTIGDGEEITITRAEIVSCGAMPVGCIAEGTSSLPFVDYHIQAFFYMSGHWTTQPLDVVAGACTSGRGIDTFISPTNGNITLAFNYGTFESTDVFRIVILA